MPLDDFNVSDDTRFPLAPGNALGVLVTFSESAERVGWKGLEAGKTVDVGVAKPRREGRDVSRSETKDTRARFSSSSFRRACAI